jgi:hypothetical protein
VVCANGDLQIELDATRRVVQFKRIHVAIRYWIHQWEIKAHN